MILVISLVEVLLIINNLLRNKKFHFLCFLFFLKLKIENDLSFALSEMSSVITIYDMLKME